MRIAAVYSSNTEAASLSMTDQKNQPVVPLAHSIHVILRYTSTGVIAASSIVTILCIFIIIQSSTTTSIHYARLLLLVTMFPISSDILFHFIFDPAPLLPLPCFYRWQPLIPIPGRAIWVTTLVWNGCAYAACFIHRHQAVIPPGFPGKFSYRSRLIFLATIVVTGSFCGPILIFTRLPDEVAFPMLIRTSGLTDAELMRVDCHDTDLALIFIGYCFFCFAVAIVFLVVLTLHIFILLRGVARIGMSEKTRSFHHDMTKALATQALVAVFFMVAPLVSCFVIYLAQIDVSLLYALTFISTHAFMHSSAVLVTTPLYRRAVHALFCKGIIKTIRVTHGMPTETSQNLKTVAIVNK